MSITNKLLMYKTLIRPIWTYGIILWGPAKKTNIQTIKVVQSICLRVITNPPWYVINKLLHDDLQVKTILETAIIFYKRFHGKLLLLDHSALVRYCHNYHSIMALWLRWDRQNNRVWRNDIAEIRYPRSVDI